MKSENQTCMKMLCSRLLAMAAALVLAVMLMPLDALAGEVTSGTLGKNDGIQWTYDADTKTLTVTGEDEIGTRVFSANGAYLVNGK